MNFAVNIDVQSSEKLKEEIKAKVPRELNCMSEFDLMRVCRVPVLGITIPQVYIKVKGVWSGGHQENLALSATNLNFGPGAADWHCVALRDVGRMRRLL